MNAFQPLDYLLGFHALDKTAYTLGVTVAASIVKNGAYPPSIDAKNRSKKVSQEPEKGSKNGASPFKTPKTGQKNGANPFTPDSEGGFGGKERWKTEQTRSVLEHNRL